MNPERSSSRKRPVCCRSEALVVSPRSSPGGAEPRAEPLWGRSHVSTRSPSGPRQAVWRNGDGNSLGSRAGSRAGRACPALCGLPVRICQSTPRSSEVAPVLPLKEPINLRLFLSQGDRATPSLPPADPARGVVALPEPVRGGGILPHRPHVCA